MLKVSHESRLNVRKLFILFNNKVLLDIIVTIRFKYSYNNKIGMFFNIFQLFLKEINSCIIHVDFQKWFEFGAVFINVRQRTNVSGPKQSGRGISGRRPSITQKKQGN